MLKGENVHSEALSKCPLGRLVIAVLASVEMAASALPVSVDGGLWFPLRKILQDKYKKMLFFYIDSKGNCAGRTNVFALYNIGNNGISQTVVLKFWYRHCIKGKNDLCQKKVSSPHLHDVHVSKEMLHRKNLITVIVGEEGPSAFLALCAHQLLFVQAVVHPAAVPVLVFFALWSFRLWRRGASPPARSLLALTADVRVSLLMTAGFTALR